MIQHLITVVTDDTSFPDVNTEQAFKLALIGICLLNVRVSVKLTMYLDVDLGVDVITNLFDSK